MIVWRDKFIAFGAHFALTLLLALAAAALIFLVWFPAPFGTMGGGTELFALVIGCDLALGPLMSLVIYDRRKSRRALITDYAVVGLVQLVALAYGVYIVAGSRPVYVAFVKDRLELVTARDLRQEELAAARDPAFATVPWWGIRFVAIDVPAADADDALFQSLSGNEEACRPKFYVPYQRALADIRAHAKPVDELLTRHPDFRATLDRELVGLSTPREQLRWLPTRVGKGEFWTAFIAPDTGMPVRYVNLDPY